MINSLQRYLLLKHIQTRHNGCLGRSCLNMNFCFFRFVVVCGDGEYIIYTAMALRNKSFGSAQEFVWAADSSEYAVRENASTVKLFKNFKERKTFRPDFGAEAIFGGKNAIRS